MSRWLCIPACVLFLTSCEESRNKQRSEIRQTFQKFSNAFFTGNSRAAASHISQRTYQYYDRIIPTARNADDAGLSTLPACDLFACLTLRHRYPAEELEGLDGQTVVLDAFDRMTFPGGAPHFLDIGNISVSEQGQEARAPVLLPPRQWPAGVEVTFVRESGAWKMDLTSVFEALSPRIEPALADPSASRAERALYYLQVHENEAIGRKLLRPSQ